MTPRPPRAGGPSSTAIAERIEEKTERDGECLLWRGAISNNGYGRIGWREDGRTRSYQVHRVVYELAHGTIPDGLHVHHTCGNRACVRPEHLETIEQGAHNWLHRKDFCKRGHDLNTERRRTRNGFAYCATCVREKLRRHAARKRGVNVGA